MLKRAKQFAQTGGYLLVGVLSIFGLMALTGTGEVGRALAAVQQQLATGNLGVSVPSDMNYQGVLRDGDGNVITSGAYDLTFKIYENIGSAQPLYTLSQAGVTVRDGRFSTTLSEIPSTVFTGGKDRFIGVTVEPFAEMVPRERLASVPYAVQAEDAFNGVPVGGVVDWWRPNDSVPIPAGYQLCDGSAVTDPDSPYVGQTTPDLRGQMVRGATPGVNELSAGGAAQQTVMFSNGATVANSTTTTSAPDHQHGLPGTTGTIAVGGADPGAVDYLTRNNEGSPAWSTDQHIVAAAGKASLAAGEGNHRHALEGATNLGGSHSHSVTIPTLALSGQQTIDTVPPHVNLLKICRIR